MLERLVERSVKQDRFEGTCQTRLQLKHGRLNVGFGIHYTSICGSDIRLWEASGCKDLAQAWSYDY